VPLRVPEDNGLHPPLVEDVPTLLNANHGQRMAQGDIFLVRNNAARRLVGLVKYIDNGELPDEAKNACPY
jgi:hypothetical protein